MNEILKTIWQWILNNFGWTVVIILIILTGLFKITKVEIDPIGAILGWFGKKFTKDVRKDVADLKKETNTKFEEIKKDRQKSIDSLRKDYNDQISVLQTDLDSFEKTTNKNIDEMKKGTAENCKLLKKRMDGMEKSNDMQTVRQIRAHVLDFANSCMNKRRHTKNEFETIINENADYEKLVKKYKLTNNVYKEDFEFIMNCYHECQKNGSFLGEDFSGK